MTSRQTKFVSIALLLLEATLSTELRRPDRPSLVRRSVLHEDGGVSLLNTSSKSGLKAEYPFYHSSFEIHDEAQVLVNSCATGATLRTVTESGVSVDVVHVNSISSKPINRVFLLFGEHSRELISPESGLGLLRMLCAQKQSTLVTDTLKDSEFEMVLNGNPRSRVKVEEGEYCVRANPAGVDLNRNWDEEWKQGHFGRDTAPGPAPFSEPETRIFKKVISEYSPTTFLTVHSGTLGLYMPWAYDTKHLADRNGHNMLEVLRKLDKKHCQCPFGAAGKEVGYSCPGTSLDWVYDKLKVPFAFAFEIFVDAAENDRLKARWEAATRSPGVAMLHEEGARLNDDTLQDFFKDHMSDFVGHKFNASSQAVHSEEATSSWNCFAQYNPNTEETFKSVVSNWAEAYLNMAQDVAGWLRQESLQVAAHGERQE